MLPVRRDSNRHEEIGSFSQVIVEVLLINFINTAPSKTESTKCFDSQAEAGNNSDTNHRPR